MLEDDESDIISSSVSDNMAPAINGCDCGWGKKNVGSVGMVTGKEGLAERFDRVGNVGDMGDDCGVLRRRNVEMGILAIRSASNDRFFGRLAPLLSPSAEERRPTLRGGEIRRGEDALV